MLMHLYDSRGQAHSLDLPFNLTGQLAAPAPDPNQGPAVRDPDGMPRGRYSFSRAIGRMLEGRELDGLEGEIAAELRGFDPFRQIRGTLVPFSLFGLGPQPRALDTTTGAGAVQNIVDNTRWIEGLRNASVVSGFGARIVTGIKGGEFAFPKVANVASVGWVGEDTEVDASGLTVPDQRVLKGKTTGAFVDVTRRMLKLAGPSAIQQIIADLRTAIASAIDAAAIAGQVAVPQLEPIGLLHTAGVPTITVSGAIAGAVVAGMEKSIAEDRPITGFATTPDIREDARNTPRMTGGTTPLWSDDGRVLGYPARASSSVPAGNAILGAWQDCLIGFWGEGVDVLVDPYTGGEFGRVRIIALVDVDVLFRHEESFCIAEAIS